MRKEFWKGMIEVGFIIFLFYSNLLMGEYERSGIAQGKSLTWALADVMTLSNFMIALITALAGHAFFDYFRKRT